MMSGDVLLFQRKVFMSSDSVILLFRMVSSVIYKLVMQFHTQGIGFIFPLSCSGEARIRVQLSAVHDKEDIDHCIESFIDVGHSQGVIS